MRKCTCKDEELHQQQQNETLALRVGNTATSVDRVEVRCENHDAEQDLVRDLDDDIGYQERFPAVGF